MRPIVVSDVLAVGEVPSREQIEILSKAGFKSLVNNQPDGELDRFMGSPEMEAACHDHGLAYRYIPLASRTPPESQLQTFAAALKELPAPVYAFCYSGSRSAAACAILLSREREASEIIASFSAAGFDVTGLRRWLETADRQHKATNGNGAAGNGHAHGNGAVHGNGNGRAEPPAPSVQPIAESDQPIIVLPRASSSSGFAM